MGRDRIKKPIKKGKTIKGVIRKGDIVERIKKFLKQRNWSAIKKIGVAVGVGAITLSMFVIVPSIVPAIIGEEGVEILRGIFVDWFKKKKKKDVKKEEIGRYIKGLSKEEFMELSEKISKEFSERLYDGLIEALKSPEIREFFEAIFDEKIEKVIDEIKNLHEEHEKILEEIREEGLKSLEEIIEGVEKLNEKEIKEEKEKFDKGFNISKGRWISIIKGWDVEREITDEIEKEIEERAGVLITGESGSGKSVLMKRVAFNLYKKGWKVYERIGGMKIKGILNSFKNDSTYLLLIDDASSHSYEIKELMNAIGEIGIKNIKILMAERKDRWAISGITEYELKDNDVIVKELKLTEKGVKNFLGKNMD